MVSIEMTAFLFRYTLGGYRGYLLSISLLYILLSSFFTKVRFPCVGFPCVGKTYVGFSHVVDYYLPRARAKERSGSKYPLNGWSIISPCVGEHVLLVSPCVKRKVSSPASTRMGTGYQNGSRDINRYHLPRVRVVGRSFLSGQLLSLKFEQKLILWPIRFL